MSLKTINGTIFFILNMIYPFGADNIDSRWPRKKLSCVIIMKGLKFIFHGINPM